MQEQHVRIFSFIEREAKRKSIVSFVWRQTYFTVKGSRILASNELVTLPLIQEEENIERERIIDGHFVPDE